MTVPGSLPVTVTTNRAPDTEVTGYVVLTRGAEKRRIPYWFRTGAARLANAKTTPLRRAGTYSSNTRGGATRVARYSYPQSPSGLGVSPACPARSASFASRSAVPRRTSASSSRAAARASGSSPGSCVAGDERRLTGYAALPFNLNPYLRTFGDPVLAAGTILPAAGAYDVVFDSPSAGRAGPFAFRFWINDSTPPAVRLKTKRVKLGAPWSSPSRIGGRRRPELGRRRGRRQGAPRPRRGRHGSGSRPRRSAGAGTRCGSRSPITRRRGTWRTSARSSRTHAS